MDRDSAIGEITRGLFLSPGIGDDYDDPLVQQALRNIDDIVEEAKARKADRILKVHEAAKRPRPQQYQQRSRQEHKQQHLPDSAVHELREVVGTIVPLLGRRFAALIGGAAATGTIADWVAGDSRPTDERMARLRFAYQVARTLGARLDDASARHWFLARNDRLNGETPIAMLAFQSLDTVAERVLAAALHVARKP